MLIYTQVKLIYTVDHTETAGTMSKLKPVYPTKQFHWAYRDSSYCDQSEACVPDLVKLRLI